MNKKTMIKQAMEAMSKDISKMAGQSIKISYDYVTDFFGRAVRYLRISHWMYVLLGSGLMAFSLYKIRQVIWQYNKEKEELEEYESSEDTEAKMMGKTVLFWIILIIGFFMLTGHIDMFIQSIFVPEWRMWHIYQQQVGNNFSLY